VADNQIVSPLLPAVRAQFDKSSFEMGYLFTGYSLAAGLSVLLWGPLSDAYGAKKGLLVGLSLFLSGAAVSYFSRTFGALLGGRVITGMGASLLSLNTISYAADYFPYASRGWAMGSIFSSYFAALILGVPMGTVIADSLGWNSAFGLGGITAIGLIFAVRRLLPDSAGRGRRRSSRLVAAQQIETYLRFLQAPKTVGVLLSAFFASAGITGFIAFVGVWLHDSFGVASRQIGLVFLVSGAAALVASPLAGSLSDRIGKRIQFIASSLAMALLLVWAPHLKWGLWLCAVFGLISLAAAFRQGPMEALMTEVVARQTRGSFIALKNASSQLGIALAALLSGIIFEIAGYFGVCLFCAGLNLVAAGVMIQLVHERHL